MALNIVRELGNQLAVTVSHPATPVSGNPVRWGVKAGVALTDKGAVDGKNTVKFDGTALLSVKGITDSGTNSAVAEGQALYYTDADTPPVSKRSNGTNSTLIGHAMGAVGSGATATIEVRLAG